MRRQRTDRQQSALLCPPDKEWHGRATTLALSLLSARWQWGCCQPIVGGGCVVVVDSDGWEAVSCKDLEPSAPQHF